MSKLPFQISSCGNFLIPFSDESKEVVKSYHANQVVQLSKITGTGAKKQRSIKQLNLFMACCEFVSQNTENQHWDTKDKVKDQVKVATNFIDMSRTIVDPKGFVHLHYRSLSVENLPHMEACKLFDQGYPVIAKHIGMTVDELIAATKSKMRNKHLY